MIKNGNLEVYDINLKVISPLFIGNGNVFSPLDYFFQNNKACIIDQEKLFNKLNEKDKLEDYIDFAQTSNKDFLSFLQDTCKFDQNDINEIISYQLADPDNQDIAEVFLKEEDNKKNRVKKEVHQFMRNYDNKVYIPGSSLKGALKTALLGFMVMSDLDINDKDVNYDSIENPYFDRINNTDGPRNLRRITFPEKEYLNINNGRNFFDVFQGIYISDSEPIELDNLILTKKIDVNKNGKGHELPILREALKPGTEIKSKLTIDRNIVADDIDIDYILLSLRDYFKFKQEEVYNHYDKLKDEIQLDINNPYLISMSGGTGFIDKTLNYPLLDYEDGKWVSEKFLKNFFRDYKPDKVVAPVTRKLTKYNGNYYPYGVCEINIE